MKKMLVLASAVLVLAACEQQGADEAPMVDSAPSATVEPMDTTTMPADTMMADTTAADTMARDTAAQM